MVFKLSFRYLYLIQKLTLKFNMRTEENYSDIKKIYLNIKNTKEDNIIKINSLEQVNDSLNKNNESSIIVESCYIINNSYSFLEDDPKNCLKIKENNEFKKLEILELIKIIGKHEISAQFIKEILNGFLISVGADNKLIIYSPEYEIIKPKNFKNLINNIYETKGINKSMQIIVSSNNKTFLIRINENNFKFDIYKEVEVSTIFFDEKDDNYIINDKNGYCFLSELFFKDYHFKKYINIRNISFKGSIQINKDYIALTSNSVLPDGKDKLIIYNKKINFFLF